jgi:cardiolipin synthase
MREKIWTIPNILSSCRLGLAPTVSYMIISHNHPMALALFMTAAATDAADGFIARRYPSQRSILGSIIDPLADKVLMTSVTCAFAYSGVLPMPLATLIVGRDIALTLGTGYMRYQSLPAPVMHHDS